MSDLEGHCRRLALPYDPSWSAPIQTHLELLAKWSEKMNLVSLADSADPMVRHVIDSLALLRLEAVRSAQGQAADLGSGAGFPGIPLAIALPQLHWTLIEPRKKRGAFLTQVLAIAGLNHVQWYAGRVPDPSLQERFSLVVSRATFSPQELLSHALPCLAPGGVLAVMSATEPDWELESPWRLLQSESFSLAGAPRWIGALGA